jgi:ABC-type uncharacterized transport system permease subunit
MTEPERTPEPSPESPAAQTAVWYFVGATFIFAASAGSILGDLGPVLTAIGFVAGAVVFVAGLLVFRRELRAKRE